MEKIRRVLKLFWHNSPCLVRVLEPRYSVVAVASLGGEGGAAGANKLDGKKVKMKTRYVGIGTKTPLKKPLSQAFWFTGKKNYAISLHISENV